MDKDTRKVLKAAEAQGFTVTETGTHHFRVTTADGAYVATFAGTGSDVRGNKNSIAAMRRHGFVWPPKSKGQK